MYQLFPTKLTDGFHCFCCCLRPCSVLVKSNNNWPYQKERSLYTIFVYFTHKNFQFFRNVFYCNSSVILNKCFNWICHCEPAWPVFILNPILTFFKQFSSFVNMFLTKTCFSVHMICTFQPPKIWCQTSVQAWNSDLLLFWIASKEIFFWD